MNITLPDALNKLAALGSPQQIADFFLDEGILGTVGHANSCPVAHYVQQFSGLEATWISPSSDHIDGVAGISGTEAYLMPRVVNDFALAFDNEEYKDLIT